MDLIKPEFGLFFWQTIVFLILIFLMAKYAWKPILGAVQKREQSINDALASAENAKKEGVKTTPSGLQYKVLVDGNGPKPSTNVK